MSENEHLEHYLWSDVVNAEGAAGLGLDHNIRKSSDGFIGSAKPPLMSPGICISAAHSLYIGEHKISRSENA